MPPRLHASLTRSRRLLTRVETVLAGLSLIALITLTLVQIVARNFFETGLPVADTVTRHLVLYVTFFGAAIAADSQRHIRIDSLATWLSKQWLARLYRPLNTLAALVCGTMTHAAVRFWIDEWQYAVASERWQTLMNLIIPLGFGLLTLHFLLAVLGGPTRNTPR